MSSTPTAKADGAVLTGVAEQIRLRYSSNL